MIRRSFKNKNLEMQKLNKSFINKNLEMQKLYIIIFNFLIEN
jgi:hypothetical protein